MCISTHKQIKILYFYIGVTSINIGISATTYLRSGTNIATFTLAEAYVGLWVLCWNNFNIMQGNIVFHQPSLYASIL